MASKQLTELTELTSVNDNTLLAAHDGGDSLKKMKASTLNGYIGNKIPDILSNGALRNTFRDITDDVKNGRLKSAIAHKNSVAYNIKDGDFFTGASKYKYILAHYNYYYANYKDHTYTDTPHWAVLVDTGVQKSWHDKVDDKDTTDGGYAGSDLHKYLTGEVLTNVTSDMTALGLNLVSHSLMLGNSINKNGANRIGNNGGCTNSCAWVEDQKISALSEIQVYGSIVFSSSAYDTGEANTKLNVFNEYRIHEVLRWRYFWLRDVASSVSACLASNAGNANTNLASGSFTVVGLIAVY